MAKLTSVPLYIWPDCEKIQKALALNVDLVFQSLTLLPSVIWLLSFQFYLTATTENSCCATTELTSYESSLVIAPDFWYGIATSHIRHALFGGLVYTYGCLNISGCQISLHLLPTSESTLMQLSTDAFWLGISQLQWYTLNTPCSNCTNTGWRV